MFVYLDIAKKTSDVRIVLLCVNKNVPNMLSHCPRDNCSDRLCSEMVLLYLNQFLCAILIASGVPKSGVYLISLMT